MCTANSITFLLRGLGQKKPAEGKSSGGLPVFPVFRSMTIDLSITGIFPIRLNHIDRSGGEGSRTLDLCIANAALSQLSYAPIFRAFILAIRHQNGSRKACRSISTLLIAGTIVNR
jgi:hypothetical protein